MSQQNSTINEARVGVAGAATLGLTMGGQGSGRKLPGDAASWSWVWFALAVAFLFFIHFGSGGFRGSIVT